MLTQAPGSGSGRKVRCTLNAGSSWRDRQAKRQVAIGEQPGGDPGLQEGSFACSQLGMQHRQPAAIKNDKEILDRLLAPKEKLGVIQFDKAANP